MATAPIRPLALEPPYAEGAAQEKAKRQKTKTKTKQTKQTKKQMRGKKISEKKVRGTGRQICESWSSKEVSPRESEGKSQTISNFNIDSFFFGLF